MEKETPSCLSTVRSSGVVHARGIAGEGQRNGAAIPQQYPGRRSVECSLNQADFGSIAHFRVSGHAKNAE